MVPRPTTVLANPTPSVKFGSVIPAFEDSLDVAVSLHSSAPIATATTAMRTRCGRSDPVSIMSSSLVNRTGPLADPFAPFGAVRARFLPVALAESMMTGSAHLSLRLRSDLPQLALTRGATRVGYPATARATLSLRKPNAIEIGRAHV